MDRSFNSNSGFVKQTVDQVRSQMPNFGVAIFDDPHEMACGWACRAKDEEKPFRFNNITELSNDTIWLTSLAWKVFNQHAGKIVHLRRIDYLRCSLQSIATDIGLSIEPGYAMESSAILAKVFHQTMMIAINIYKWQSPANELRFDALHEDISRVLPKAPKAQPHTRSALLSSLQSFSSTRWSTIYEHESINIIMRLNRMNYAEKIMSTMVPDDTWTCIPNEAIQGMRLQDFLDVNRPSLVEACVDLGDVNPEIADLIAFGLSTSRTVGVRKWLSQPELAWITRYAKVSISSAIISQSARPLPRSLSLPMVLTDDPIFSLSISAGLVAESHWNAIATPVYSRGSQTKEVNSWAVWLRAADRSMSFSLALKAHEAGLKVTGYGGGAVNIRTTRDNLKACLQFAEENEISHPVFQKIFNDYGVNFE